MSGSSGLNMTPEFFAEAVSARADLVAVREDGAAESLRLLPERRNFAPIFRIRQNAVKAYNDGTADENTRRIMENCLIERKEAGSRPDEPARRFGERWSNFNPEMMEKLFEKIGTPYKKEDFEELVRKGEVLAEDLFARQRIQDFGKAQLEVLAHDGRTRARVRPSAEGIYRREGGLYPRFAAVGAVRDPQESVPRQGGR